MDYGRYLFDAPADKLTADLTPFSRSGNDTIGLGVNHRHRDRNPFPPWLLPLLLLLFNGSLNAQPKPSRMSAEEKVFGWSLEDCWRAAAETAPELRLADLAVVDAEMESDRLRFDGRPYAAAQTQWGYQLGRSIDPTTNAFADRGIAFNTTGIVADWTVYDGGRRKRLAAAAERITATDFDRRDAELAVKMRTLEAYARARAARAEYYVRKEGLEEQRIRLKQLDELIGNGIRPSNDRLELELEVSRARGEAERADRAATAAEVDLAAIVGLGSGRRVIAKDPLSPGEMLNEPELVELTALPAYRAARARERAAIQAASAQRSSFLPEIDLFARLGTNYSAAARELVATEDYLFTESILLDGEERELAVARSLPRYGDKSLLRQWKDNANQVVGVRLRLPLYDGGRRALQFQRARLGKEKAALETTQVERRLGREIERHVIAYEHARTDQSVAASHLALARRTRNRAVTVFQNGGLSTVELKRIDREVELAKLRAANAGFRLFFASRALKLLTEPRN